MTNRDKIAEELPQLPEEIKQKLKNNRIDINNVDHVKTFIREELDAESLDAISGGLSKKAKWGIGGDSAATGAGGLGFFVHKKNKALENKDLGTKMGLSEPVITTGDIVCITASDSQSLLSKAQSLNEGTSGDAASEISKGAEAAEGGAEGVLKKVAKGTEEIE